MQRRTFLGVVGSLLASPTMFVKQMDAIPRIDPNLVPTGFPLIDKALGGGLGAGELHSFISDDNYRRVPRSIAIHAAKSASVAYLTNNNYYFELINSGMPDVTFHGNLAIYHNLLLKTDWHVLESIVANHDMIVLDHVPSVHDLTDWPHAHLCNLAQKHKTRIMVGRQWSHSVLNPYSLSHYTTIVDFMARSTIKQLISGNQLKLVKNRRGPWGGTGKVCHSLANGVTYDDIFPIQNVRSKPNLTYESI